MSPDSFLQKMVHIIGKIKAPFIIAICCIAIFRVLASVFSGGEDKREVFRTIVVLLATAALLFYIDKLIIWMEDFLGG